MLSELILAAAQGDALWMPDLRAAFASESDAADLVLRLRMIRGNVRDYPLRLPRWHTPEEQRFVAEYLYASVYNLLSVCSGQELILYSDWDDKALLSLIQSLTDVFQVHRSGRRGYGKVINDSIVAIIFDAKKVTCELQSKNPSDITRNDTIAVLSTMYMGSIVVMRSPVSPSLSTIKK